MFKLTTGLVALGLLVAAPAFAEGPAKAPAAPAPAATTTTKEMAKPATKEMAKPAAAATTLMDINSADAATLATLKGVGTVRAAAIIKGRPYKGKDDLLRLKIVPENVYNDIKDQIIAKQK